MRWQLVLSFLSGMTFKAHEVKADDMLYYCAKSSKTPTYEADIVTMLSARNSSDR